MKTYWLVGKSRPSVTSRPQKITSIPSRIQTVSQQQQHQPHPQPQTRIAKVPPFFSAGQLEGLHSCELDPTNDQSLHPHEEQGKENLTRTVSLGQDPVKAHVTTQVVVEHGHQCYDMSNNICPVKNTDMMICRKIHGYSWNNLWNGIHRRRSFKVRSTNHSDDRTAIPDYC